MFIRKNKNRSGSISVQIISKRDKKYQIIKTIGSAKDPKEIEKLFQEAQVQLHQRQFNRQSSLFVFPDELIVENFLENLSNAHVHTIGPELITPFGKPLVSPVDPKGLTFA